MQWGGREGLSLPITWVLQLRDQLGMRPRRPFCTSTQWIYGVQGCTQEQDVACIPPGRPPVKPDNVASCHRVGRYQEGQSSVM